MHKPLVRVRPFLGVWRQFNEENDATVWHYGHIAGAVLLVQRGRHQWIDGGSHLDIPHKVQVLVEDQDALILGIGHYNAALVVTAQARRPIELMEARALMSLYGENIIDVWINQVEAVVVKVRHYDVARRCVANASWRGYSFGLAMVVEHYLADEATLGVELLDAMIARVGDHDLTARIHGHIPRILELAVLLAIAAKLQQEDAAGGEDLHTVVVLVHHNNAIVHVHTYSSGQVKLAIAHAFAAELEL